MRLQGQGGGGGFGGGVFTMYGCVTGAGAAPGAAGGTWALAVLFLLTAARRWRRRIPG